MTNITQDDLIEISPSLYRLELVGKLSPVVQGSTEIVPPISLPNDIYQIRIMIDRCTTDTPTYWPDANNLIEVSMDTSTDDIIWNCAGKFTQIGGIYIKEAEGLIPAHELPVNEVVFSNTRDNIKFRAMINSTCPIPQDLRIIFMFERYENGRPIEEIHNSVGYVATAFAQGAGTSLTTASLSTSGTNKAIATLVGWHLSAGSLVSVKWGGSGGVNQTAIAGASVDGTIIRLRGYRYINPSDDTGYFETTLGGAKFITCVSLNNVDQTTPVRAGSVIVPAETGSGTPISGNVPCVVGDMVIGGYGASGAQNVTVTTGSGQIERVNSTFAADTYRTCLTTEVATTTSESTSFDGADYYLYNYQMYGTYFSSMLGWAMAEAAVAAENKVFFRGAMI